jgi:NAD(P)-dependent dehydrogenase (short-subunit alcohol dehydrogenase family)
MKLVIIGAQGTIGKKVSNLLSSEGHEIIQVGKKSGDYQADLAEPETLKTLFQKIGRFDSLAIAAGEVAFAPLEELTLEQWQDSFQNKLLGQIQAVQKALPYIRDGGSFTLIGGSLSNDPIKAGTAASTVNRALEGFVISASCDLPRGLRINLVSPTVLEESVKTYGNFFPGVIPVAGDRVAQAYKKSILGCQTGQIYFVT